MISSIARIFGASLFSGMFASMSGRSSLWVFFFVIGMMKAMIGTFVLAVILAFEFVIFPFTTIYYFVKRLFQFQHYRFHYSTLHIPLNNNFLYSDE